MKLLVDCTPLHSGGGVQVAIAFLEGLSQRDDIEWLAVVPARMRTQLPILSCGNDQIITVAKSSALNLLQVRFTMRDYERQFNPDVVFTIFGPAYFRPRARHLVGFALPRMIYEPDDMLPESPPLSTQLANFVRSTLLRKADHIVVETETVRKRLAQRIGFDARRISVIGNSVNPLLLRHEPTPKSHDDTFGILIPSAHYPHKNLEIIPAVAAELARYAPDLGFEFRLTLDPATPHWKAIAQDAARRGIGVNVMTLGVLPLDALARAYQSACAVFLPTVREASTAVFPESFYFRRPLVTSNMDFARELCGNAAAYVPPREPESIAKCLAEIACRPKLREKLVEAGSRQLVSMYPSSKYKFDQQMSLLLQMAEITRRDSNVVPADSTPHMRKREN